MDTDREKLWNSLTLLRTEIGALSEGRFDGSERQLQLIALVARIVLAELEHREKTGTH
jgi:hypothetical protein